MKNKLVLMTLFTLIACTSSLKRNVAQSTNDLKVKFYDSQSCTVNHCDEKIYDLSQDQEKEQLLENLNQLQKKSKSFKSDLKTADTMED